MPEYTESQIERMAKAAMNAFRPNEDTYPMQTAIQAALATLNEPEIDWEEREPEIIQKLANWICGTSESGYCEEHIPRAKQIIKLIAENQLIRANRSVSSPIHQSLWVWLGMSEEQLKEICDD